VIGGLDAEGCQISAEMQVRQHFLKGDSEMSKKPHTGLDGRDRDEDGETRRKNGNTLVGTLRETYGSNFAPHVRSDMKLETLLEQEGARSLSELLKKK
jgi:hypothetical protein